MARKTVRYNVGEAKAQFSRIVGEALAGTQVVIARGNQPLLELVPFTSPERRLPGSAKGRVSMAADFDEPLDDFADYR